MKTIIEQDGDGYLAKVTADPNLLYNNEINRLQFSYSRELKFLIARLDPGCTSTKLLVGIAKCWNVRTAPVFCLPCLLLSVSDYHVLNAFYPV